MHREVTGSPSRDNLFTRVAVQSFGNLLASLPSSSYENDELGFSRITRILNVTVSELRILLFFSVLQKAHSKQSVVISVLACENVQLNHAPENALAQKRDGC